MTIAPYLKIIGRGKAGARALDRLQARDLMQRILGGQVSDLELGAFALAMRIKGETPDELAGFVDAAQSHSLALSSDAPAILLPSYNGARKLPNFTPLLALLLAREGVPVLVHGLTSDPGRVTSAEVFQALDLPPVADAAGVRARWSQGLPAFLPLEQLNPALARLLAVRRVLGLRNPGHTIAKILPALPQALQVVNYTHPEYAHSLADYQRLIGGDAMLMRGTEGEPVADCRRLPRFDVYLDGELQPQFSREPEEGSLLTLPLLPDGIDAAVTARHIEAVLSGQQSAPAPILEQARCLLAAQGAMTVRG
ncbi:MAG TPA: DNA-binding protein YbiB [Burkholderiaceae bacterium]|nr:DNA-binding protein YbiB [Burkholderiaceae bacterium]HMZ00836.1 DNA-binding protein YbiB [Burkholderiaceae bacterium]HNG78017.1 DNA-binding protein YbiB [Burkholderiaceae bacterium]